MKEPSWLEICETTGTAPSECLRGVVKELLFREAACTNLVLCDQ